MSDDRIASAWRYICTAQAVRCLADRSWSFFLPLYLSRMCTDGGLRPTAAVSIVQNLAVATFSTATANVYRRHRDPIEAFLRATVLENVAVALGGLCMYAFVADGFFAWVDAPPSSRCSYPFQSGYFILALFCGAVDAIFSSLLSIILSKEWVAVLFRRDSKRTGNVLMLMVSQHLVGACIIIFSARRALHLCPELSHASEGPTAEERKDKQALGVRHILSIFRRLPTGTQLITAAYVLLYFTVLSPGSVLNAWMNSVKHVPVTEETIAYFGSVSQLCGALATIVSPLLIRFCSSLYKAAAVAQWFQMVCVSIGTACFCRLSWIETHYDDDPAAVENASALLRGFLCCIGLSRLGLWVFDLVERQIVQEAVPRAEQTLFFNAERGTTQFVSLAMMYLCYIFPDSFDMLVVLSTVAVCSSSALLLLQFCIPSRKDFD